MNNAVCNKIWNSTDLSARRWGKMERSAVNQLQLGSTINRQIWDVFLTWQNCQKPTLTVSSFSSIYCPSARSRTSSHGHCLKNRPPHHYFLFSVPSSKTYFIVSLPSSHRNGWATSPPQPFPPPPSPPDHDLFIQDPCVPMCIWS